MQYIVDTQMFIAQVYAEINTWKEATKTITEYMMICINIGRRAYLKLLISYRKALSCFKLDEHYLMM